MSAATGFLLAAGVLLRRTGGRMHDQQRHDGERQEFFRERRQGRTARDFELAELHVGEFYLPV